MPFHKYPAFLSSQQMWGSPHLDLDKPFKILSPPCPSRGCALKPQTQWTSERGLQRPSQGPVQSLPHWSTLIINCSTHLAARVQDSWSFQEMALRVSPVGTKGNRYFLTTVRFNVRESLINS